MPLPHISASEPSALKMRMRRSATGGGKREDEAVRAEAEVPVADAARDRRPVPFAVGLVEDVVVAPAVHLGYAHEPI